MKTIYRRFMIPAALVLFCALLMVATVFQYQARAQMRHNNYENLEATADTISRLATAYYGQASLESDQFYLSVTAASRAANAQTVICDKQGKLVLCSEAPYGCAHQGLVISRSYLEQVYRLKVSRAEGRIKALYDDARYVVGMPIYDRSGNPSGLVLTSVPMEPTLASFRELMTVCVLTSLGAVLVATLLMALILRKQNSPLQEIRRTANDFAHGKLSSRVKVNRKSPVDVQELALAFNNMAESLEKAELQRQEFVANVSHELKTPMTTISGFMDGMLDGTIPASEQPKYMALVSEETKRLSRLVRSMLDISRLPQEGGVPEERKSQFDVAECAGRVLITFEQKILAKELDVHVNFPEHPVYTRADQDSIIQVIYNLLDNAVKFCQVGGRLGVEIRQTPEKIYVAISNTGNPIPVEELPFVFERFHKIDKSRTDKDGWGLGLYIVKTIVCSHGENIRVSSAGDTTEFTFTLPCA